MVTGRSASTRVAQLQLCGRRACRFMGQNVDLDDDAALDELAKRVVGVLPDEKFSGTPDTTYGGPKA